MAKGKGRGRLLSSCEKLRMGRKEQEKWEKERREKEREMQLSDRGKGKYRHWEVCVYVCRGGGRVGI